jgi:hypothetical protein
VNEAFRRENGYLGRDFASLTKPPECAGMLGLVGPKTTYSRSTTRALGWFGKPDQSSGYEKKIHWDSPTNAKGALAVLTKLVWENMKSRCATSRQRLLSRLTTVERAWRPLVSDRLIRDIRYTI